MNSSTLGRALGIVTITLALATPAAAQTRVVGTVDDFATASGVNWELGGEWSATLNNSGLVDIVASLTMKGTDPAAPGMHTHHVTLTDGVVSVIAGGYRITGTATILSNGAVAAVLRFAPGLRRHGRGGAAGGEGGPDLRRRRGRPLRQPADRGGAGPALTGCPAARGAPPGLRITISRGCLQPRTRLVGEGRMTPAALAPGETR